MKRKKTHAPQADADEIAAIRSRLDALPAPHEPFDFHERARAAEEARRLYDKIGDISRQFRWNTDARNVYQIARERYHAAIIAAYPPEFGQDLKNLREGDTSGMENILTFLEADPIFYATGYLKEDLARWIKPEMLTVSQTARLRGVILLVVDRRNQRDFGAFCRLARKIDAPELRQGLHQRLESDNPYVRCRARWMLDFLETKENMTKWLQLKPKALTPEVVAHLRGVILSVLDRRNYREFGAFCQLARKIDDSELRRELQIRVKNDESNDYSYAGWMLDFLEEKLSHSTESPRCPQPEGQ